MKPTRVVFVMAVMLAAGASIASAAGMNLYWNDCSLGGVTNKSFACNTNAGTNDLYISFDPTTSVPDLNGANAVIDLQTAAASLGDWWQFKNVGSCRLNSLSAASGFGTCLDAWSGQAASSIAAYLTHAQIPSFPLARSRILTSSSVSNALAASVEPGTEYLDVVVRINNAKTVGADACAGCQPPVCIVLSEVLLTSVNSGDLRIFFPLSSNFATWQGGLVLNQFGCPGGSPTVSQTWGQMKSLYR